MALASLATTDDRPGPSEAPESLHNSRYRRPESVTAIEFERIQRVDHAQRRAGVAEHRRAVDVLCRALNVLVAVIGLVVAAPLMLLIALAVRLTSRGPVVYRQTRVGHDRRTPVQASRNGRRETDVGGRPFTIYKFRTMYVANDERQVWADRDDPRITPVGRMLRRLRFDEFPQLFNVLRGEMNLVGPRPEQPEIFAQLRERVDDYAERQRVLPGITGWAQINQHYDTSEEDVRRKLQFDLEYISKRSVTKDLRIMARTIPVMVFKRGAW